MIHRELSLTTLRVLGGLCLQVNSIRLILSLSPGILLWSYAILQLMTVSEDKACYTSDLEWAMDLYSINLV
jgi:hypothetical protein